MSNTLLLLFASLLSLATVAQSGRVVCYYGSWATYRWGNGQCDVSNLDPNICTVLIYSFAGLDSTTNSIVSLDPYNDLVDNSGKGNYKKFNDLRKINPSLTTLIAIGGWNEGSSKYSIMASNSASRKQFLNSVISFIQTHGFNGLDLDWEYPALRGGGANDKANFALLIKELREEFDKYGYILSAAVGASEEIAQYAYDIPSLSKYLHFINVMTYDYHGSWETNAGHNAPLYPRPDETSSQKLLNLNASIHYFISKGAEPSKLILGIGTYGQSYTLADPNNNGIYAPAISPGAQGPYTQQSGILGYNEICEKFMKQDWTVVRELYYQAPYAYSGNQWVGYDDAQSIWVKCNWAKNLGLGGGMVWSIETDDFRGICGNRFPLVSAIVDVFITGTFREPTSVPAAETTAAPAAATTAAPTAATTAAPTAATTAAPTAATTAAPTAATTPSSSGDGQNECSSAGHIRDSNDCSIFYQCVLNGGSYTKYRFQCQPGLVFDETASACNWQSAVPGC